MKDWFLRYVQQVEERKDWAMYRNRYLCPCCFMPTLNARAAYDVCKICDWEDDGQDSNDAAIIRGGPNGDYSLREARDNFAHHFTMYRPTDTRPFTFEQMDRRFKEHLHTILSDAVTDGTEDGWRRALESETEVSSTRARQNGLNH
ncbi:MAG: CPCC family cysteine-rich protein [Nitrospira sp.]|nr:CPCC family cysteine-rich protein [Nitrospira sp.]